MKYESTQLISRIEWCRLQQQLHSATREERAGWRAEEAGLVDALGGRERITFMRGEQRSQFTRYQCGLEDGQSLLRLSTATPYGMTPMEGLGPAPFTTPAQVDSRPSQAPPPVHVESPMTCPRCDGLVVHEYLFDPWEGPMSGFHASRCVNCGAIHDDVIRMNQRVPPSLKQVRSPRRRFGPHVPKRRTPDALATLGWSEREISC